MQIKRKIASLNIHIDGPDNESMRILDSELALYSEYDSDRAADVIIDVCENSDVLAKKKAKSRNPTIFSALEDGVAMKFGLAHVFWSLTSTPIRVQFAPPPISKNWIKKLRSIQYTYPHEAIGQIFHELVLIPMIQMFFSDRFAVIHGSSVGTPEGDVYVFSGTGGVGKTSMMLELVEEQKYDFIADDITVLSSEGNVHANFAFPKIYGYNTLGSPSMKKKLLGATSYADRIAWNLQMKRMGPSGVRRRVNPKEFFDGQISQSGKLKKFFILFRTETKNLSLESVSASKATEMNLHVMKSEYAILYNHLHWYQFNCLGTKSGIDERLSYDRMWEKSRAIQLATLENVECLKINVPMKMTAQELKDQLGQLI
jgi:hypothetical protein